MINIQYIKGWASLLILPLLILSKNELLAVPETITDARDAAALFRYYDPGSIMDYEEFKIQKAYPDLNMNSLEADSYVLNGMYDFYKNQFSVIKAGVPPSSRESAMKYELSIEDHLKTIDQQYVKKIKEGNLLDEVEVPAYINEIVILHKSLENYVDAVMPQ